MEQAFGSERRDGAVLRGGIDLADARQRRKAREFVATEAVDWIVVIHSGILS
jgi:hypothetical protein